MIDFMQLAIEEALNSDGDIPVGAVIVHNNEVLASACNRKEKDNDITSHAEILAIRRAETVLNNWRLDNCDMYVTLEPCPMCGWAIIQSRIKNLFKVIFHTPLIAYRCQCKHNITHDLQIFRTVSRINIIFHICYFIFKSLRTFS